MRQRVRSWLSIGISLPEEDLNSIGGQVIVEDAEDAALIAIQELYLHSKKQAVSIAEAEAENASLLERVGGLEARDVGRTRGARELVVRGLSAIGFYSFLMLY